MSGRLLTEASGEIALPPDPEEACDGRWRRWLMAVGHDPLKPAPHGSES